MASHKPVYKSKINISVAVITIITLLNQWGVIPLEYQARVLETANLIGAALIFYFRTWRTSTRLTWARTSITDEGEAANRRDY